MAEGYTRSVSRMGSKAVEHCHPVHVVVPVLNYDVGLTLLYSPWSAWGVVVGMRMGYGSGLCGIEIQLGAQEFCRVEAQT